MQYFKLMHTFRAWLQSKSNITFILGCIFLLFWKFVFLLILIWIESAVSELTRFKMVVQLYVYILLRLFSKMIPKTPCTSTFEGYIAPFQSHSSIYLLHIFLSVTLSLLHKTFISSHQRAVCTVKKRVTKCFPPVAYN